MPGLIGLPRSPAPPLRREESRMQRTCFRCKQTKLLEEFAISRKKSQGRDYICKICSSAYRYEKLKRRGVKQIRSQVAKEGNRIAVAKFREKHPERIISAQIVARALKHGELVRPDKCSKCGKIGQVESHHPDYSKPLEVQWLCTACHGDTRIKRRWLIRWPSTVFVAASAGRN